MPAPGAGRQGRRPRSRSGGTTSRATRGSTSAYHPRRHEVVARRSASCTVCRDLPGPGRGILPRERPKADACAQSPPSGLQQLRTQSEYSASKTRDGSCFCHRIDLLHCRGFLHDPSTPGRTHRVWLHRGEGPRPGLPLCPRRVRESLLSPRSAPRAASGPSRCLPKARIYPDTKTLLAAEAKNLDFVDIATPPCDHAAIAHVAFEHGLHVFCEKPIATSGADARSMLDHAERVKRVFFPSHNYKHAPVIKAIRKVLESGASARSTWSRSTRSAPRTPRASPSGSPTGAASARPAAAASRWTTAATRSTWRSTGSRRSPPRSPRRCRTCRPFDTEDNFNCTVTFPDRHRGRPAHLELGLPQGHLHDPWRAWRHQGRGRRHRDPPQARGRQGRGREAQCRVELDGRRRTPSGSSTFTRTSSANPHRRVGGQGSPRRRGMRAADRDRVRVGSRRWS